MTKVARIAYLIASWLFLAGVTAQVFLAGMVIVARQSGWGNHRESGHGPRRGRRTKLPFNQFSSRTLLIETA